MASTPGSPANIDFLRSLLIIRLINAFWVTTFFQPDEYFQALEPAWQLAFGADSGAWMTWEWHHQLRSSIHPAIFSAAYIAADYISNLLPLAVRSAILIAAPRALQSVFAALGDWYTARLAVKIYPESNVSSFSLFSAWQWYCSIRTFSNSLETTLTAMALYYFPWHELLGSSTSADVVTKDNPRSPHSILRSPGSLRASLALASLAIVLRPTNGLIWAPIISLALLKLARQAIAVPASTAPSAASSASRDLIIVFLCEAALCGSVVLNLSVLSDRLYFGFWTFPPYNWLTFNISKSLAVFYGRNPWHYYLLQGLPLLCTTSLPFVLYALYKPSVSSLAAPNQAGILRALSSAVFVTIGALSLISHKEVRFIYPLLPVLNVLAAPYAASFFTAANKGTTSSAEVQPPTVRRKPYLFAAIGVNILLAGFLSIFHQPAQLTVLNYLRSEYERLPTGPDDVVDDPLFALFLMPCHSTPWRSHLIHPGLHAYALSCEPPLHTAPNTPERDLYRDQADRFYDDPIAFLSRELFAPGSGLPAPRYIVGFEGIEPWLIDFLETTEEGKALNISLRQVWDGFNGFFNEDWRRAGRMIVWDTGMQRNTLRRSY